MGTELEGTSLEVRGGVSIRLMPTVAAFGSVDYTTGLSGETQRSVGGNLGIRVRW
ncbi:autotransporter outer membrane beta-barrel domain-containing protein [Starkeya sp. 3C]|uniref:Autotransporter outer membrane beta-barrel domain-containing protein n=1 Tax=Ancylobacter moscoviensis TaxID=2597768 RepID=A0ABY3DPY1_9HYPH|nr:autotransporter outer membrane beta-barrel domain-containing protein [Ancylobacter moscoviensis]